MKKQVKWAFIALALIAAAGYGIFAATRPLEVNTVIIEPRDATMYFISQGHGVRGSSFTVYPLVSGEITSVAVREGERVVAGDTIAIVNYYDTELLIRRSEANIAAIEAQMSNLRLNDTRERNSLIAGREDLLAQNAILEARSFDRAVSIQEQINLQEAINRQLEAAVDRARSNYQNLGVLFEVSAVSRDEYEAAERALEDTLKQLEQGELALSNITSQTDVTLGSEEYFMWARTAILAQLEGIERNLAISNVAAMEDYYRALIEAEKINITQFERHINDAAIRTPVSGLIERLYMQDTNVISPNMPVADITTDEEVSVEVFVRTRDIVYLNLGDEAEVIFRARGGDITIQGSIREIDDRAVERLSPLGVVERNVKVSIDIAQNDIVRDGYDVDVRFTYYSASEQMIVPRTALFRSNGKDMLWTLVNGRVEMREVVLGAELRIDAVVESGLAFGDVIIRDANNNRISEGTAVKAIH